MKKTIVYSAAIALLLSIGLGVGLWPRERARRGVASNHHLKFGEITSLIDAGNYRLAVEESRQLKEAMKNGEARDSYLYAYNLLRIALLEGELGSIGESTAWDELMSYGAWQSGTPKEPAYMLLRNLQMGEASLLDYIAERKRPTGGEMRH